MTQTRIEKLTPEQEALIPIIRDEWLKIALDNSPTNKQQAEAAIFLAYECAGLKPPQQILWFDNPLAAVSWMTCNTHTLGNFIYYPIWFDLRIIIDAAIDTIVDHAVRKAIENAIFFGINNESWAAYAILSTVWEALEDKLFYDGSPWIELITVADDYPNGAHQVDELGFYAYFNAIGIEIPKLKGWWETAKHCGWWWSFEKIAIVTPKPSAIRFDADGELHGEGLPAIAYEGFNIYAYHGVVLPEKYSQVHPNQWQAQWLLEENNAELRRVLIQGIGYEKITYELQAIELDAWKEYTLLKIANDVDIEPIVLLKMTCPSTGFIHILRVPPDVTSAREAICWVNRGINPEDFSVQT
jgi:hypothetical protein